MRTLLRTIPLFLGALAAAAMAGGCAFVDRNAPLKYTAEGKPSSVVIARIALAPIVDERPEPRKLGDVRNGYGMKTATIWAANPVDAWVTDALTQELRVAGVEVLATDERPPYAAVLSGQIQHASCVMLFSYEGSITLRLELAFNGRTVLSRTYARERTGNLNWTGSSKQCGKTMNLALKGLLEQAVPEIVKALKELPPGPDEPLP